MSAKRTKSATLGATLAVGLPLLTELILAERNAERRKKLVDQHKVLSRNLQELIEENVDGRTREYKTATQALVEANKAIRAARKDLKKVAETIEKIAKAADLLGKLAAMVV